MKNENNRVDFHFSIDKWAEISKTKTEDCLIFIPRALIHKEQIRRAQ